MLNEPETIKFCYRNRTIDVLSICIVMVLIKVMHLCYFRAIIQVCQLHSCYFYQKKVDFVLKSYYIMQCTIVTVTSGVILFSSRTCFLGQRKFGLYACESNLTVVQQCDVNQLNNYWLCLCNYLICGSIVDNFIIMFTAKYTLYQFRF